MNNFNDVTVLLIANESFSVSLNQKTLETIGYKVLIVSNGEKAIEIISSNNYNIDIILLDIDIDGVNDSMKTVRGILSVKDIPIIRLSSCSECNAVANDNKILFYGYIFKESEIAVIDASIKMALNLFQTNQKLKISEDKLFNIQRRFDMLAEHNRTVFWEIDLNGVYTFVSGSSLQVFGYAPEELIGIKRFYDLYSELQRDELKDRIYDFINNKICFNGIQNPVIIKNNRVLWVSSNGVPAFNNDGSCRGYYGIDIDITEQRLSSELIRRTYDQLAATLNALPDLLFEVDREGRIYDYRTPRPEALFIPPELFMGKLVRDILPLDAVAVIESAIAETSIKGRHSGSVYALDLSEGHRWFEISMAIKGGTESIGGRFIMIARDITERKAAENKIHKLLQEKEIILKEVHHRIKNNMNTVYGLLLLQADACKDGRAADILIESAGRLRSMMVLYDRLYRGENSNSVSMNDYFPPLIKEISELFASKTKVKYVIQISDIVLPPLVISPLGIIINELIVNALKYAFNDRNEGCITIRALKEDNRVTLIFEDNGAGLPQDITIENTEGFGLQLVNLLVRQINGSIFIERNNGTKFIINFNV